MQNRNDISRLDQRARVEFGLTVGVFGFFAFSLLIVLGPVVGS